MAELLLGCSRVLLYWPDRKNVRLQLANASIAVRRSLHAAMIAGAGGSI